MSGPAERMGVCQAGRVRPVAWEPLLCLSRGTRPDVRLAGAQGRLCTGQLAPDRAFLLGSQGAFEGPGSALPLCAPPSCVVPQPHGPAPTRRPPSTGGGALWCCCRPRTARLSFLPGWLCAPSGHPPDPLSPLEGAGLGRKGMGAPGRWGVCPCPMRELPEDVLALPASSPARPGHHHLCSGGPGVLSDGDGRLPVCSALVATRPDGLWQEVWNQRRLTAGLHVFFLVVLRVWAPWPCEALAVGSTAGEQEAPAQAACPRLVARGAPGPRRAWRCGQPSSGSCPGSASSRVMFSGFLLFSTILAGSNEGRAALNCFLA